MLQIECGRRQRQISKVASTKWGSSTKDLRALYKSYSQSKLMYAAPGWMPLLSESEKVKLSTIHNRAARSVTGNLRCTRAAQVLLEADLLPLKIQLQIECSTALERANRLPVGDPLRALARDPPPSTIDKVHAGHHVTWSNTAHESMRSVGLEPNNQTIQVAPNSVNVTNRQAILLRPSVQPWACEDASKIFFFPTTISLRSSNTPNAVQRRMVQESLRARGRHDYTAWTDGSVVEQLGGCGAVLFSDQPGPPLFEVSAQCGEMEISYTAEMAAIQMLLSKIAEFPPD